MLSLLPAAGLLVFLPWAFRAWRQMKLNSDLQQIMLDAMPGGFCFVDYREDGERLSSNFSSAFGDGLEAFMATLDEDHHALLVAGIDTVRGGGDDFDMTVATRDGTRHFEVAARAVPNRDDPVGMILWLCDVSDREAASAAGRAARDRLIETLDTVPLPIWRRAGLPSIWTRRVPKKHRA